MVIVAVSGGAGGIKQYLLTVKPSSPKNHESILSWKTLFFRIRPVR